MNVGIIIPHRGGEELRTNFANAAAQGFHHAQLVSWDPRYWTEENAREVSELTKEFDIEITPKDLVAENFNSLDALEELIERLQDA